MAATLLATDEDVAIRAAGDFAGLCPKDQKLAYAEDGVIPANAWTLTSASIASFASLGVTPGNVVQLIRYGVGAKAIGEHLVVDTVATGTITLRRKGQVSGLGMPPGGAAGLSGVTFLIATLTPQVEDASYDLDRRYGLDDLISGRRNSDMYDPREVKQATVLTVLKNQYFAEARRAGQSDDSFYEKGKMLSNELRELLDRVVLHWKPTNVGTLGGLTGDSTNKFSMKLTR